MVALQKEINRQEITEDNYVAQLAAQQEYLQDKAEAEKQELMKKQHDAVATSLEKAKVAAPIQEINYKALVIFVIPDFTNYLIAIGAMIHQMNISDANTAAKSISLHMNSQFAKAVYDKFGVIIEPKPSATVVDILKYSPDLQDQLKTKEDLLFHNVVHNTMQDAMLQIYSIGAIKASFEANDKPISLKKIIAGINNIQKSNEANFKEARATLHEIGERQVSLFHDSRNENTPKKNSNWPPKATPY